MVSLSTATSSLRDCGCALAAADDFETPSNSARPCVRALYVFGLCYCG